MAAANPAQLQVPPDLLLLEVARHLQLTTDAILLCHPHMLIRLQITADLVQANRVGRSMDLDVTPALKASIPPHHALSYWLTDVHVQVRVLME